jgi:predicted O-methyltransferase YrrM
MLRSIALLALARAARPPLKLGRRAALSLLTPMPANAMWQLWLPSDMERFVAEADANADSVLAQMDKCAETSWMMNMGSAKGILIEKLIQERRPKRLLEIGTFLGYMSIRLARSMPDDAILTTVEIDDDNYAASRRIRAKALGKRDESVVALKANASHAIQSFKQPFDFVLMDHWKPDYARDLEALRKKGLLADKCLVVADNVLFPGAPELLDYLHVPYVPATDAVSGQACLQAAADIDAKFLKRAENDLKVIRRRGGDDVEADVADASARLEAYKRAAASRPARDAVYSGNGFATTLERTPFEYRPDTPDAMTFSEYSR